MKRRRTGALLLLGLMLAAAPPVRLGEQLPGLGGDPAKAFDALVLYTPAEPPGLKSALVELNVRFEKREGSALLADGAGIVRRQFKDEGRIVAEIKAWRRGKSLWDAICARCHGFDGQDTSYVGTRSLRGYGNGRTDAQVRRAFELTGTVDLTPYSDEDRNALAIFVAGL